MQTMLGVDYFVWWLFIVLIYHIVKAWVSVTKLLERIQGKR